jgi:hypothetical protein
MNLVSIILLTALAVLIVSTWAKNFQLRPRVFALENIAEGVALEGQKSFLATAAHAARFLLVKKGADAYHIAVAGAGDDVIGISEDTPGAADDGTVVALFGAARGTRRVATKGVFNFDTLLVPDDTATGLARALPATAGTYRVIGRSLNLGATEAADVVEFVPFDYVFVTVEESS